MFKPSYNIKYARKHLEWMKKSLYHPLFIAYAYNGGIGFFKKHLLAGTFSKGEYEPYLSMELMSNAESREYGKRVLANYVMYKKILGEDVLHALIDMREIIQISPDVIFHLDAYEVMVQEVLALIETHDEVDAKMVRDSLNTSRKYAIALLEHLDLIGLTKRVGDVRVRGKARL